MLCITAGISHDEEAVAFVPSARHGSGAEALRPNRKNISTSPRRFTGRRPRGCQSYQAAARACNSAETLICPGSLLDSMRLARFTVAPQTS